MIVLGIETSCDETSAAIIEGDKKEPYVKLLSNIVSSSLLLHAKTGGIIPEKAAREQVKYIIPVLEKALGEGKVDKKDIDAIGVTVGPGLIGSLLVGVETAKTLSYIWEKPLIPVNHLYGHIYANFVSEISNLKSQISNIEVPEFPAIALIVSGGHTDLVLMKNHGNLKWLGGTRDDAAGEAFDKIGRVLGLSYPGGEHIEKLAKNTSEDFFNFPRPLINSGDFDFSFSGLKTAVFRQISQIKNLDEKTISSICYSTQQAIIDVLVTKTLNAAIEFDVKSILLGGGVAANNSLRGNFKFQISNLKLDTKFFVPEKRLCTDNAAMIATAAFFSTKGRSASGGNKIGMPWQKVDAIPDLYFDTAQY